jgi:DNA polymerase-3 subunit beta
MKLTCKQQDLAKGLSIVGHAVSTRATLPILLNVRIAAEGDAIRLSATNLEIGITCRVPANVQEEGVTTIPARLLTEFVGTLPQGDGRERVPGDPDGRGGRIADRAGCR